MTALTKFIEGVRGRLSKATPSEPGNYLPELEPHRWAKISSSNDDFEFNVFDEFTLEEDDSELIASAPTDLSKALRVIEVYRDALDWYWLHWNTNNAKLNAKGYAVSREAKAEVEEILKQEGE